MPRYCLDLTLHYPFGVLYKEPLGYIEEEEWNNEKTIVHCCCSLLVLEFASLYPLEHFLFFPSLPFSCDISIERWRIEVVEAQVGESVSPIRRRADRGCNYCNLCFISIEISSFLSNNVYLNEYLIHGCFQMLICC